MNPLNLSASDMLIWGIVLHLIADWPLQNDWIAKNKMKRRQPRARLGNGMTSPPRTYTPPTRWWQRHMAAYLHAWIHGILLSVIFGWAAVFLAFAHLIIDCRWLLEKWSKFMEQTQPGKLWWVHDNRPQLLFKDEAYLAPSGKDAPLMDVGIEVQIWTDQVFHIVCIAIAALLVSL